MSEHLVYEPVKSNNDVKGIAFITVNVLKRNWHYYLLSLALCLALVNTANYKVVPTYNIKSDIIIQDNVSENKVSAQNTLLGKQPAVENEIEVLRSPNLMRKVVNELDLNVNIYKVHLLKNEDMYSRAPFSVSAPQSFIDSTAQGVGFTIKVVDGVSYQLLGDKTSSLEQFGKPIRKFLPNMIILNKDSELKPAKDQKYLVVIQNPQDIAENYKRLLSIDQHGRQSNIVSLRMTETNAKRGELVMQTLLKKYTEQDIETKSAASDSAYEFLSSRLEMVSKDLNTVETDIESFKNNNGLVDVATQSHQALTDSRFVERELRDQELQLKLMNDYKSYFNTNLFSIAPFYPNIKQYPNIVESINQYNNLMTERTKAANVYKDKNPVIKEMDAQLAKLRVDLLFALDKVSAELLLRINVNKQYAKTYNTELASMPHKERGMLDYTRKQGLLQELYMFLLKSREEIALTRKQKASIVKMINQPKSDGYPTSPKSKSLLLAIALGLGIPSAVIFFRQKFNFKVLSVNDLVSLTEIHIIGKIGHIGKNKKDLRRSVNMIEEQFRFLRTNLLAKKPKCLLITSSIKGEGKSFVSINIAHSLAIMGKKVILLELDLRQPAIANNLGLSYEKGFSQYVTGEAALHEIIVPSGINENLEIVVSGGRPGNPSEMLAMHKTTELIEMLKQQYDHVIIDSPPIGLVSDAQTLAPLADSSLYIVRFSYSTFEHVNLANDLYLQNKLPNPSIVLNDIDLKKARYEYIDNKTYGYGYGYGYENGYAIKKTRKNELRYIEMFAQ